MHNKKLILVIVILMILAGGIGFWVWPQKQTEVSETPAETPAETFAAADIKDGLGAEAFKKTSNPLSNELPETNPFRVNTNPFK